MNSLFSLQKHPFVWTAPEDRPTVLANVNEPVWGRFLEEVEKHFSETRELRPPDFPIFCHDGDLDEVMAVSVLAYVRNDARYWRWIASWLRSLSTYFQKVSPGWHENLNRMLTADFPGTGNPRQFFEGFTKGGMYWVEAGLMSAVLHLLDLIEAYAPDALSEVEKTDLSTALADFAVRYAFHEEALKYSNRGVWGNAGMLISALAHPVPDAARLLLFQAEERNIQLRSTFMDDACHLEGAPDYHLMTVDALLCFALTAARFNPAKDYFGATTRDESRSPYLGYPGVIDLVRGYLRTTFPGPTPMQNNRGISVYKPVPLRPSLIHAYGLTKDPEIGWFIQQQLEQRLDDPHTPLKVTPMALLGLGDYQPLMNFWLYRPLSEVRQPSKKCDLLPDHGTLVSRSSWNTNASCVAARFGYEGTAKCHRDHGHVTLTVAGRQILSDPFPRQGPKGNQTSLFHNTITIDNAEPSPVIGRLADVQTKSRHDSFLILNSGGTLPNRVLLHDPRQESNFWFTNQPRNPGFEFKRAVLHVHDRCLLLVDRVRCAKEDRPATHVDWFFHTPLIPEGYQASAPSRSETYKLQQRTVLEKTSQLDLAVRGHARQIETGIGLDLPLTQGAVPVLFRAVPLNAPLLLELGHHETARERSSDGLSFEGEIDYFLRYRSEALENIVAWMAVWDNSVSSPVFKLGAKGCVEIELGDSAPTVTRWIIDFEQDAIRIDKE